MDGKISGWKYEEKHDICLVSKYFLQIVYIFQREKITLQQRNLVAITLTKRSVLMLPVIRYFNIMYCTPWYKGTWERHNITSGILLQKMHNLNLIKKKTLDKVRNILQNRTVLNSIIQKCQGHER